MQFILESNEHNISLVRREGITGNYKLNCNSTGLNGFIVICANNKQDLVLHDNQVLKDLIEHNSEQLALMKFVESKDISFSLITFAELMRNGGFNINNKPGFYTVYGCNIEGNSIKTVFYSTTDERVVNITIDIEIHQENAFTEIRKLFRSEKQYSGYKKITIPKGVPSITESCVYYMTPDRKYRISVPLKVLKNGGSFFVASKKEDDVQFIKSDNNVNLLSITKN